MAMVMHTLLALATGLPSKKELRVNQLKDSLIRNIAQIASTQMSFLEGYVESLIVELATLFIPIQLEKKCPGSVRKPTFKVKRLL